MIPTTISIKKIFFLDRDGVVLYVYLESCDNYVWEEKAKHMQTHDDDFHGFFSHFNVYLLRRWFTTSVKY